MRRFLLIWTVLVFLSSTLLSSIALSQSSAPAQPLQADADTQAIQKIEDDLLKAENTTDVAIYKETLADDYINLIPRGLGPDKAAIIQGMQPHAGQAPPYSVETSDMHVYILGDTAVAAYVKTYTAKENGNVDREDTTHVFVRDHGAWKLKLSRASKRGDG